MTANDLQKESHCLLVKGLAVSLITGNALQSMNFLVVPYRSGPVEDEQLFEGELCKDAVLGIEFDVRQAGY